MVRFNKSERAKINKCIMDAQIARFSQEETVDYIKRRLGLVVSVSKIAKQRCIIRQEGKAIMDLYRRDSYAFKLEFYERVLDIKRLLEIEWFSLEDALNEGDEDRKEKCISTIERLEAMLANFLQYLPAVDNNGVISNSEPRNSVEQSQEETQLTVQRKF